MNLERFKSDIVSLRQKLFFIALKIMRDIEGYELQEIAEITGTQISAVTVNY